MKTEGMFPLVITEEIIKCKGFYEKYFDFDVIFDSDWYIQIKNSSGVELGFMMPNLDNQPNFLHKSYNGKGIVITFEVSDAEKEFKRLKESGLILLFDLKTEEWGQKHFMIEDPAGIVIDIVEQT